MSRRCCCFVLALATLAGLCMFAAPRPPAAPASAEVVVEWTTESEVNLAGFNLYRSENPGGPYTKLNETLIPASPDPVAGGSYSYVDATAEAGVTYYYKLEDVELDGTATTHGPIVVVAEGAGVSPVVQAGVLLTLLAAVLLGVAVLLVRRRRQNPAGLPRAESGGRREP